jgi:ADP-L-glycero-D-manno-heptose 6-epimerase
MYVVTGGAGFIGSNVAAALAARGDEVIICDWLRQDERWRNLSKHEVAGFVAPEELPTWLDRNAGGVRAVIHLGAMTSTTETDIDLLVARNVRFSLNILDWCTTNRVRLIYASSAATYGDGAAGFDDSRNCDALAALRPLNAYAWSKHVVDRRIARLAECGLPLPPQWAGLKFFNVYGPNEYHKGPMQSLAARNYALVKDAQPVSLFRSYRADFRDGEQMRDFIYVDDCVDVVLWLLEQPEVCGLYNVGTGAARSWLEFAQALFDAVGQTSQIRFIDMPRELVDKYQYFTQAAMSRLRAAGYQRAFTGLEAGVARYVRKHLATDDPYR